MHDAPSVTYPVGRSRFALAFILMAWLLGAAAGAAWAWQAGAPGWRHAAVALALGVTGAVALWHWWRSPAGELAWAGGWTWHGRAGCVAPALDVQAVVLLRWQDSSTTQWLWLERARCPERWSGLRRAVYSRANPDALPGAQPPAATP
jgi:hypothetical protein